MARRAAALTERARKRAQPPHKQEERATTTTTTRLDRGLGHRAAAERVRVEEEVEERTWRDVAMQFMNRL